MVNFQSAPTDVPSEFVGEYDLSADFFAYSEFMANTHLDRDVIDAGLYLGLDLLQIEEAYRGQYNSDADFAEQYAEETGAVDSSLAWPYLCIDWEWAARDLMYDFSEHDHHYFYRH